MAQSALNGRLEIPKGAWTLISEINCTFLVLDGTVEVLGTDAAVPDPDVSYGVPYQRGTGEEAATDTLARYAGAGTADGLYVLARHAPAALFVSRAEVL